MIPVTFIQWGGQAGGGFAPVLDDHRRVPAQAFQALADEYVRDVDGVPQPPAEAPDIAGHPALGLRMVAVPGHGDHWCFSVQVKGGSFGRTGICQFLFAAAGDCEPAQVWEYCVASVAENDGVLPRSIAEDGLPEDGMWRPSRHWAKPSVDTVSAVLVDLADGNSPIRVDGAPGDVAAAIGGLLRVVPVAVARERVWTTYLLIVPGDRRFRFVSGLWPAELREEELAGRVARWLSPAAALPTVLTRPPEFEQAIEWLAYRALNGASLRDYHHLPSMAALVAEVCHAELTFLRPEEIPAAVDRRDERVLRPENHPSLLSWARAEPDAAIEKLCDAVHGPVPDAVFDALVEAHLAALSLNLLRLPPSRHQDPRWSARLRELLLRSYPELRSRVAFVRGALTGPGMPLARSAAKLAARQWFVDLGFDEDDPALADLFPVTVAQAAEEFSAGGVLGARGLRYLESDEPVPALKALIAELGVVTPAMAMELARHGGDGVGVSQVLRAAIMHNEQRHGGFGTTVTEWLTTAISLGTSPTEKETVLRAGRAALLKAREERAPAATVLFGRTVVAVLPDEAQLYREILLDLADLAEGAVAEHDLLVTEIEEALRGKEELERSLRQSAMDLGHARSRLVAMETAQRHHQSELVRLRQRHVAELVEVRQEAQAEIDSVNSTLTAELKRVKRKLGDFREAAEQRAEGRDDAPDRETAPDEGFDSHWSRPFRSETWPRTRNNIIFVLLILLVVGAIVGGTWVVLASLT